MKGRTTVRWVVLLLCGLGLLAVLLRWSRRDEVPIGQNDHLWRLSYELDFEAAEAGEKEKELLQAAAESAAKQIQVARMTIQTDIREAREKLKGQIQAFSLELAQRILGRSI